MLVLNIDKKPFIQTSGVEAHFLIMADSGGVHQHRVEGIIVFFDVVTILITLC